MCYHEHMTGAQLLRFARLASGTSQHVVARRTRTHQPSIWAIENAAHDPTVATLSRLLAGLGNQVTSLPTLSLTAATAAASTHQALEEENLGGADVSVLQLADDLAAAEPVLRAALVVGPAPSTGDRRYDAWIAAVVEYRLAEAGIPAPTWVHDPSRVADQEWVAGGIAGLADVVRPTTPEPFARRRVLFSSLDLQSV